MNTLIGILALAGIIGLVPTAYALDDGEYFVDDFESITLTLQVQDDEVVMTDGFLFVDGLDFDIQESGIKKQQYLNNGDYGRIFGQTSTGEHFVIIYEVEEDDIANMKLLIWINGERNEILSEGTIESFF